MKKAVVLLLATVAVCFTASASLIVTAATGGGAISADSAANGPAPAWTTLGPIQVKENGGHQGDFGDGADSLVLTAPSGFEFNTSNTVSVSFTALKNITSVGATVGSSAVTLSITVSGTSQTDSITITNLQVRPTQTAPLASGNITGTSSNMVFSGSPTFGTLTEVAGAAVSATQLAIQTQPSTNATAGVAFVQQPVIALLDQFGAVVTSDNTTVVTAERFDGTGTLQGTLTATATNGIATFTDLFHTVATSITIRFTSGSLTNVTSTSIDVAPATADHLAFTVQPDNAVAGVAFGTQPVVITLDQFGNPSTVGLPANLDLSVSLTTGLGPLNGTTNIDIGSAGANGVATFTNLSIAAGAPTNQLTASASGLSGAISAEFAVSQTATQLGIQTQPSSTATAGVAFAQQPSIAILDDLGGVVAGDNTTVVTAERFDGTGTLQGTLTATAVNGIATFTDLYHTVATTITIRFTSGSLTNVTSSTITVAPATADHLVFSTQPGGAALNAALNPQPAVKTQDQFGNDSAVGLSASVPVALTISSGTGSLVGTTTLDIGTAAGNGSASFSGLSVDTAGDKQLTASASGLASAVSSTFTISKGDQTITFGSLSDKFTNSAPFTVSASASSGLTVTFSILSGPASIVGNTVTLDGTAGVVTVRASQAGDANYNAASDVDQSFNVLAIVPPNITSQPVDQTVVVGGTATFTVGATGTSLNYQWSLGGTNLAGATASSLVLNPVHLSDAGVYSVTVSNAAGFVISSNATLTVTTITNDIDFDGNADLLLQSTNNFLALWNLSGTNFVSSVLLNNGAALTSGLRVVGQGDFNHDGQTDLILQNGGLLTVWLMNGTNVVESVPVNTKAFSKAWKVIGVRDFNHDGSLDILLLHDSGYVSVWFMNGTTRTKAVMLNGGAAVSTSWKIVGLDDFNHDGNVDLLWQNRNGNLVVWYMNGVRRTSAARLGLGLLPSQGWRIVGLVDLNADGTRDVLWQNTDGRLFTWFMDGVTVTGSNFLLNGDAVTAGWSVVGEK